MTNKVFFGWTADKDKVENGMLSLYKNGEVKLSDSSSHLSSAGIYIHNETYVYFDDEIDKVEFFFNEEKLPDWVKPLVRNKDDVQRVPNSSMDIYTMECVRDLIYWWFNFVGKELSKERKNRIAKIVGLNFHKERYTRFINYGFNHPEYLKWLKKDYEKRHKNDN